MEKDEGTKTDEAMSLHDAERASQMQAMNERGAKLSRIAKEIEDILIREGLTWGDWGDVVELFHRRIGQMVSVIKIKE